MNPDKPVIHDFNVCGMKFHIVETPENPELGISLTAVNDELIVDMDLLSLSKLRDIVDRTFPTLSTQPETHAMAVCTSQIYHICDSQQKLIDKQLLMNMAVAYRIDRLAQRQKGSTLKKWLLNLAATDCQQPESTGRAFQPYTPIWISPIIASGYAHGHGLTVVMIPSLSSDIHGEYIRPKHDLALYPLGGKDGLTFFLDTKGVVELRANLDADLVRQMSDLCLPNFTALI